MATSETVRLTQHTKSGGCASKLAPGSLQAVLAKLPRQKDDMMLVGFDTSDDAGVYQISPDLALVNTVDFFTPLIDDPYTFGQVAATNALSDVYAMGGRPITALAVVCFPEDGDFDVLAQIMKGGLAKMAEAGCAVVGGHTVRDAEVKFGYAITGLIDPARVFTNSGAKPGDKLILTKPIGTGVITTALKQNKAQESWVAAAISQMTKLNKQASDLIVKESFDVHAVTDVTGFGLMGHARELARGSEVSLEIQVEAIPLLEGALEAVHLGAVPAGLLANREFAECIVSCGPASDIAEDLKTLLYDPQTSGGLLISLSAQKADELVTRLHALGIFAAMIGRVLDPQKTRTRSGEIRLV